MFSISQLITASDVQVALQLTAEKLGNFGQSFMAAWDVITKMGNYIKTLVGPFRTNPVRTAQLLPGFGGENGVVNFISSIKRAKIAIAKELGSKVFSSGLGELAKDMLPDMLDDFSMFMVQEFPEKIIWVEVAGVRVPNLNWGIFNQQKTHAVNTLSGMLAQVNVHHFCIINNMINLKQFGYNPYTTLLDDEIYLNKVDGPSFQYWEGSMAKGAMVNPILAKFLSLQPREQQRLAHFDTNINRFNPMIMEVLNDHWNTESPPAVGGGACIDTGLSESFLSIYKPGGRLEGMLVIPGPNNPLVIRFQDGSIASRSLKGGEKLRRKTRKRKNKKKKTKRKRKKMRKTKKKKRRKQKRSRHRKKRSK